MKLRKLEQRDAPLMLEWMHDPDVVGHLATDFSKKSLSDCQKFIAWAAEASSDLHLAVADAEDVYMGTVSLKHIQDGTAEFAITVRSCAMGKGFAQFGMASILKMGLTEQNLSAIYWCVSPENHRAVRFYDKNGYVRTEQVPDHIRSNYTQTLIWYVYKEV